MELRDKPVQILSRQEERFIGMPIIANPKEDAQIACVLRLVLRKQRQVDIRELHECGVVEILRAEVEVDQFDVPVRARAMRGEVLQADSVRFGGSGRSHGLFIRGENEHDQGGAEENQRRHRVKRRLVFQVSISHAARPAALVYRHVAVETHAAALK